MSEDIKAEQKGVSRVAVDANRGILGWKNIDGLQRLAIYLFASKMLPKNYSTPEQVGVGIQFAVQLGFRDTWLLALRQIAVINGTPSMFGDLPLAVVRSSGKLEAFEEFLIDKDYQKICYQNKNLGAELFGAVCIAKRVGEAEVSATFTVQDAKTAELWGKNVWRPYPKRMIQMRVRSMVLKDGFGDVLNGMAIGEYDHNTILEKVVESEVVSTTINSSAAKLNSMSAAVDVQQPDPIQQAKSTTLDLVAGTPTAAEAEASPLAPAAEPEVLPAEDNFENFQPTLLGGSAP